LKVVASALVAVLVGTFLWDGAVTINAQARRGGSFDAPSTRSSGLSSTALHVCHAGSLLAAFTQIEEEFKKQHPNVAIADTSGGSVDLVRRFAAGRLECDVIAPADHLVIDAMLKPARLADYSIVFASGRMVLAYLATDPRARGLPVTGSFAPPSSVPQVAAGWYDVLTAPGVRISGAHAFMDPGGYRAHMIFELAQAHYKVPGLQHYQVNVADPSRPAPALGKDFSFQFTYEHNAARTAKQDPSYRYAMLPSEIDLSRDLARKGVSSDAPASIVIPGLGIPGTAPSVTITASRVEWGVTVPVKNRNRDNAVAFVALLLGSSGRDALNAAGPAPTLPARVTREDSERLPPALRALTRRDR
jgi:molybdate/tungstate transport system substrate-binding protein